MEKIQFRALKFIYDDTDSTYEELLAKSKLPTLKIRRMGFTYDFTLINGACVPSVITFGTLRLASIT